MRAFVLLLAAASGPAAAQTCELQTSEPGILARLSSTRNAVELHKQDADTACLIALDCEVRQGEVKGIDYELATLTGPKVPPRFHQVRRVTFNFAEGGAQTCAALTVLQPPKRMKTDPLPSTPTPAAAPPAPPAPQSKPEPSAE